MTKLTTNAPGPRSRFRKIVGPVWRATLGRWFKRIDFIIVRKDLTTPDPQIPEGRRSPVREGRPRFADHATQEHVDLMAGTFSPEKLRLFRRYVEDPRLDFEVRLRETDGFTWCYMMHADYAIRDPEYGYKLPICEGRDIMQFDGWVNPEQRGRMVGIEGTNFVNSLRREEGFERLYATLNAKDVRSARLHKRMGFTVVGEIWHLMVGPFKFNRVKFEPGEHPQNDRVDKSPLAKIRTSDSPRLTRDERVGETGHGLLHAGL